MKSLIEKALTSKSESKHIEFKQGFDPNSSQEWCELIKDIVAIANSGGGIIVFGLDCLGTPTDLTVEHVGKVDPAEISNKISRYAGSVDLDFEVLHLNKNGKQLVAFLIPLAVTPLIFKSPGTYDTGQGKQRSAFSLGTIYFRHGAKSEPGTSDDLRRVIERRLEEVRKSWLSGVRKVVKAPVGSKITMVAPTKVKESGTVLAPKVRAVNDPDAIPVILTRDATLSSGSFIHEEVSDGIFDEINNVIDANRILTKGRREFLLGQPVYYRIYAERQHVKQSEDDVAHLLHAGILDFYAPSLYWALTLPDKHIIDNLVNLYFYPNNRVHYLIRIALLLGKEFSKWLLEKWQENRGKYTQAPNYYWKFKETVKEIDSIDPLLFAARTTLKGLFSLPGESPASARELMARPELAVSMLSKACILFFQGYNECKALARNLDFIAYGPDLIKRAPSIGSQVIQIVGNRKAGDLLEANEQS